MADSAGLRRAVESRAGIIAHRLAIDVATELDRSVQRHKHIVTGEMIQANKVGWSRTSPTTWRIDAENRTLQAATTSHGARRHPIPRRKNKYYAFVMDGRKVVVRWTKNQPEPIDHPGNKASHWFEEVMNPITIRGMLSRFVGR